MAHHIHLILAQILVQKATMFHVNLVIMKALMYVNVANLVTTCLQSQTLVIVLCLVMEEVVVEV